ARPEAGAVLHAHSPYATALACLRREIPPFHYMIARFGGDTVRCADYASFGTQQLSDNALSAMSGRNACLLANHGLLVFGRSLKQAFDLGVELEALCEQYVLARQVGEPVLLDAAEMQLMLEKFRSYGQQRTC
ncbi:MAG: class II aldolase, partial [Rhodocyclaceae bacterium]